MSENIYNATEDKLTRIAGGTLWADSPIGTILAYGGAVAPSGWFLCDGTAISRTTYSELFAVIGESFGAGDGSTTFNLPDMRESVPKGAGLTGKTVGNHVKTNGLSVGEFLDDRVQEHKHYRFSADNNGSAYAGTGGSGAWTPSSTAGEYGSETGHIFDARHGATTEVKSVGVNYIIKAKMVAVPADFLAKVDEAVEDALEIESGVATLESGLSGTITWHKSGRVVDVLFNNVRNESGAIASGAVLATNFPKPLYNTSVFVSRYPNESNVIDVVSGSNPQFKQTGMYNVSQGIGLFGSFTYISAN